ncbi:MAG: tetratricopeptide repeat protein, partial [Bacteroidota bacterium]
NTTQIKLMSDASPNDLLITQYLDGTLSPVERAAFEARLEHESDLAEAFALAANLEWGIRAQAIQERKQAFSSLELPASPNARTIPLWTWASAAAAIALLCLFWWISRPLSPEQLYAMNAPERQAPLSRSLTDQDSLLRMAHITYNQADYTQAIERYQAILQDSMLIDKNAPRVFLGLSYLQDQQSEAAISVFETVDSPDEQQNIDWYLALAYLQMEQFEPAIAQLQMIIKEEGHYYRAQAQEALEELE